MPDVPVVGDWNGDGKTKVGVFRLGFFWVLDTNGDKVFTAGEQAFPFGGLPGDIPVVRSKPSRLAAFLATYPSSASGANRNL